MDLTGYTGRLVSGAAGSFSRIWLRVYCTGAYRSVARIFGLPDPYGRLLRDLRMAHWSCFMETMPFTVELPNGGLYSGVAFADHGGIVHTVIYLYFSPRACWWLWRNAKIRLGVWLRAEMVGKWNGPGREL